MPQTKLLSAFDPSKLAAVEHTHAQGHTLMETDAIHWWAANHSARGAWGYGALLKGTSAMTRRWTTTSVSPPICFEWWEWESNCQPSGFMDDPLDHSSPNVFLKSGFHFFRVVHWSWSAVQNSSASLCFNNDSFLLFFSNVVKTL